MLKDKIRQIRTEKHLSQSELARQSGHAVSTIHGIENGNNKTPGFEMIGDIAKALNIPLDELYRECKEDRVKQLLPRSMMISPIEQANELIRALICKSEPCPCEWCDAQNCQTCNLNTENNDDECKFSLAVDAVEPENKPLTLEQETVK